MTTQIPLFLAPPDPEPRPVFELEYPSQVLPDPDLLTGPVCADHETTGLFVDDGARVVATGLAYRRTDDPGGIHAHAFPFDIGDAAGKGFEVQRLKSGRARGGDDSWDEPQPNLPREEWEFLTDWMVRAVSRVGYVNQNAKFDLHHFRGGTRFWPGVDIEPYIPAGMLYDTMLGTSVLDPAAGTTSLKPTAARFWGEAAVEEAADQKQALVDVKKRYGLRAEHGPRYDLVPWDILGPYTFADGVLALRLHELQMERLDHGEASPEEYVAACRLMRVLYRIERRGLGPYDIATSTAWADRIDDRIQKLEVALPFGPPTPTRATAYFFDELGLMPWEPGEDRRVLVPHPTKPGETKVEKAGTLTVDVARRMAAADVPGAAEYAEFLDLTMANRMFYRNYAELAGEDGRLRTSFRQAYVRSGRMSVERFQAQALPKHTGVVLLGESVPEPRSLFLVPEGRRRVNLDLTQAELRIAAKLSGCTTMVDALATGADFHGQTTTAVFGLEPGDPEWSAYRDIAKRLTFGSIFMIGAARFQATLMQLAGVKWELSRCREAVNAWRMTYPEFGVEYEVWSQYAQVNSRVQLYDGSFSWFGPRDYPNTAWNRRVQGSLAKWVGGLWLPMVERLTARHEALVLTVHDSCLLELPEEVADEVVSEVKRLTAELWLAEFGIAGGCEESEFSKG